MASPSSYQAIQQSLHAKSDNLQKLFEYVGIAATLEEINHILYDNGKGVRLPALAQQVIAQAGQTYDQMLAKALDGSLGAQNAHSNLGNPLREMASNPEYADLRVEINQVASEFDTQAQRLANGEPVDYRAEFAEASERLAALKQQAQIEQQQEAQQQEQQRQQAQQDRQRQQQEQQNNREGGEKSNVPRNAFLAVGGIGAASYIAGTDKPHIVDAAQMDRFLHRSVAAMVEEHHRLTEKVHETITRIENHPTVIHALNTIRANSSTTLPVQIHARMVANESIHSLLTDGGTLAGIARQHVANIKELTGLQHVMSKLDGPRSTLLAQSGSLFKDGQTLEALSQKFSGVEALQDRLQPIKIDFQLVENIRSLLENPAAKSLRRQQSQSGMG